MNYTDLVALGSAVSHLKVDMDSPTFILPDRKEDLTTMGIFISSLLLSIGGLLALMSEACRRSRCTKLNLFCVSCDREPLPVTDEALPPLEMQIRRSIKPRSVVVSPTNSVISNA
mgnify:CR=1 FL=1